MSPCNWPLAFINCDDDAADFAALEEPDQERIKRAVTEYLWHWSGRIYGTCPYVIRPCREPGPDARTWRGGIGPTWKPVLLDQRWYTLGCGTCGEHGCRCGAKTKTLTLPSPTQEVTKVTVDGAVLPATAYRLDNFSLLTRTDGEKWPVYQDLSLPPGELGTWEVEFVFGHPVPEGGQIAAGVLAIEFTKALCDDRSCRLPQRVQSITRQGVTVGALIDTMDDLDRGRTGIWIVDSWIASLSKPPRGASVRSPDVPRRRVNRRLI